MASFVTPLSSAPAGAAVTSSPAASRPMTSDDAINRRIRPPLPRCLQGQPGTGQGRMQGMPCMYGVHENGAGCEEQERGIVREVQSLDDGWEFAREDVGVHAALAAAEPFEPVVLPHTWNAID